MGGTIGDAKRERLEKCQERMLVGERGHICFPVKVSWQLAKKGVFVSL